MPFPPKSLNKGVGQKNKLDPKKIGPSLNTHNKLETLLSPNLPQFNKYFFSQIQSNQ
jgi:hypothetical protein